MIFDDCLKTRCWSNIVDPNKENNTDEQLIIDYSINRCKSEFFNRSPTFVLIFCASMIISVSLAKSAAS